jgi:hypothetical protein
MFAKWNKNIKNRFQPKIITPDPKTTPIDPVKNYIDNFYAKGKLALGYKYDGSENPPELDKDSIGNNISIATEFYKYAQSYIHSLNPEYGSPTQGFIPISLGITMNGISGIKIFNSLGVDTSFLPNNYPKALRFITKAINHKISNQDWETTLETLVIPETHNGASLIVSFSTLSSQIGTLLFNNFIDSVVLDETTGNLNTPSWLTERFAALRVAPGTPGNGNFSNATTDFWMYKAWQQGPYGLVEHYKISKGTMEMYSLVSSAAIYKNWPGQLKGCGNPAYTSPGGLTACDVVKLYNKSAADNKRLATEYLSFSIKGFEETRTAGLTLIQSGTKNRTGMTYKEISDVFQKVVQETNDPTITYEYLVAAGQVENGLQTDTCSSGCATPEQSVYFGMFQMSQKYFGSGQSGNANLAAKYSMGAGSGHKGNFINYAQNNFYEYIKDVVKISQQNWAEFVKLTGYPN